VPSLPDIPVVFRRRRRFLLLCHALAVVRLCLILGAFYHGLDFFLGDERTLHAHWASALRDEQSIAHTDELFRATLVQDDSGVGQRGGSKSQTGRNVGLDQDSHNIHGWTLRGQNQVDTCRTSLLCDAHDGVFDFLRCGHHQVRQLVDDTDDKRIWTHLTLRARRCCQFTRTHLAVEVLDVAHTSRLHVHVALFHLFYQPLQGSRSLLRLRNEWRCQVRNALIRRQFHHLRIHQNQAHIFGSSPSQQRDQQGVDKCRFTGTGSAGDQQVRHLLYRCRDELTFDVFAQTNEHGVLIRNGGRCLQYLTKTNHFTVRVRHLNTHGGLARNRRQQTYVLGRNCIRQVGLQVGDLRDLHARSQLDFVASNCRTTAKASYGCVDLKLGKDISNCFNRSIIDLRALLRRRTWGQQVGLWDFIVRRFKSTGLTTDRIFFLRNRLS